MALLWLTFIESFSTLLLERGIYFYTRERFAFSASDNLWLALAFGVLYASGAAASHPLARLGGERSTTRCWRHRQACKRAENMKA
jgi:hypothetical protein